MVCYWLRGHERRSGQIVTVGGVMTVEAGQIVTVGGVMTVDVEQIVTVGGVMTVEAGRLSPSAGS